MNRLACHREPVAVARARSLACARRGAVLTTEAEGAFDGGHETRVHADELFERPAAVLLQMLAGPGCPAHERVAAAVEVSRRAAAPPFAVVGHERKEREVSGLAFDAYAPSTAK